MMKTALYHNLKLLFNNYFQLVLSHFFPHILEDDCFCKVSSLLFRCKCTLTDDLVPSKSGFDLPRQLFCRH